MQFDIGIELMKAMAADPRYLTEPVESMHRDGRPVPPIQGYDASVVCFSDRWRKCYTPYLGHDHIVDRLLFGGHLACYTYWDGGDSVFPCQFINRCRRKHKEDLISFCENTLWQENVQRFLDSVGIAKVLP